MRGQPSGALSSTGDSVPKDLWTPLVFLHVPKAGAAWQTERMECWEHPPSLSPDGLAGILLALSGQPAWVEAPEMPQAESATPRFLSLFTGYRPERQHTCLTRL